MIQKPIIIFIHGFFLLLGVQITSVRFFIMNVNYYKCFIVAPKISDCREIRHQSIIFSLIALSFIQKSCFLLSLAFEFVTLALNISFALESQKIRWQRIGGINRWRSEIARGACRINGRDSTSSIRTIKILGNDWKAIYMTKLFFCMTTLGLISLKYGKKHVETLKWDILLLCTLLFLITSCSDGWSAICLVTGSLFSQKSKIGS